MKTDYKNLNSTGVGSRWTLFLTCITYLELVASLVMAYIGFIASSGLFFREGYVIFVGIPGVSFVVLSLLALKSTSTTKKKAIVLISGVYIILICVLGFANWYQTHKTNNFYENLYMNTQNGMTYEQVRSIAGGKEGRCIQVVNTNTASKQCMWSDATYGLNGTITSGGSKYVAIDFDSNGLVKSKLASGH